MNYVDTINAHKADIIRRKTEGEMLDFDQVFAPVNWEHINETKEFTDWLLKQKLATRSDIKNARDKAKVIRIFGRYPATCCEYIALYAEMRQALVTYDGQISVVGEREIRQSTVISDYQTEARVHALEFGIRFGREAINDAIEVWHKSACATRLDAIRVELEGTATFDWTELVRRCFDVSEMSEEIVAATLRKFIHQIKRKLANLTVGNHLMPVILGPQGSGKSWFLHWLTDPIAELRRDTDFRAIGDERNIGLWSSYALMVDEMAYADKSDIETVKHVITADVLDRRPMRRNNTVRVRQCATLIGASNKSISELVRDETGTRRFLGLHFRADADWDYLNAQCALDAWRSVSAHDPDPLDGYREELLKMQASERHVSPVEAWLESLRVVDTRGILPERAPPTAVELYQSYLTHFHTRNDGHRPKTMAGWEQELGRLLRNGGRYAIEKFRTNKGIHWRWVAHESGESQ